MAEIFSYELLTFCLCPLPSTFRYYKFPFEISPILQGDFSENTDQKARLFMQKKVKYSA